MGKMRFWILHLYSCLSFNDLEILYSKLCKWGLELQNSNSWADCFEIKKRAEKKYKIIPVNTPVDNINLGHWKLKAKNNKHYVFEYDEQCTETGILIDKVKKIDSYVSEVVFLLAFPICAYYFIQTFNICEQSVLPRWINYLFVVAIISIYLGHFISLLISLLQTKHYANSKEKIKRSNVGFWGRITISGIVNILQIVLILIVLWGIMRF